MLMTDLVLFVTFSLALLEFRNNIDGRCCFWCCSCCFYFCISFWWRGWYCFLSVYLPLDFFNNCIVLLKYWRMPDHIFFFLKCMYQVFIKTVVFHSFRCSITFIRQLSWTSPFMNLTSSPVHLFNFFFSYFIKLKVLKSPTNFSYSNKTKCNTRFH